MNRQSGPLDRWPLTPFSKLFNHSAVAILIRKQPLPAIMMVKRANRIGDPWSGDMAFPGGRRQLEDLDHIDTALRELQEETGLRLQASPIAKLPMLWTKSHNSIRPMTIHPFIFDAPKRTRFQLSDEIAEVVWVPYELFQTQHPEHFIWQTKLGKYRMPCYHYRDYRIWGLSLKMIENLPATGLFC